MNEKPLIEYACYDEPLTDKVKTNVFTALDAGAKSISVPMIHLPDIRPFIPDGICLSCPIDYPNGRSINKIRIHSALKAAHYGVTAIDVVANTCLFVNKKKQEFLDDLSSLGLVCKNKGLTLRVMVDYRKLENGKDFRNLLELVKIAKPDFVYCSTGCWVDDAIDNILYSRLCQKDFNIPSIANGNIFLSKHITWCKRAGLFGIRFHKINALKNCVCGV